MQNSINQHDTKVLYRSHIEHFKPKGNNLFPELQLDYSNLHASCIIVKKSTHPDICGHRKGSFYSADLISPLEANCTSYFTYTLNGKIKSGLSSNNRASESIKRFGLDEPFLNEARESLIKYFEDIDDVDDRVDEILNHLDETKSPIGEYFTMIDYLSELLCEKR